MSSPLDSALPSKDAHEVDFPVERVEGEHVSRREFAKFLCLVSGGLAVGSGWGGGGGGGKGQPFPATPFRGQAARLPRRRCRIRRNPCLHPAGLGNPLHLDSPSQWGMERL